MPLIVEWHPIFFTERVLQIWHFVCILRVNLGGICLGEIHEWQKYAQGSSYNQFSAFKEGFGILHEQWMSLLVAQTPIFCTEGVLIWYYLSCNLRVNRSGKWHDETHKWLADAFGNSSHLPYVPQEGVETLHKQWMSPTTVNISFAILKGY